VALVEKTALGLSFYGDDLDPDELTHLLGCTPTRAHRKGDPHVSPDGRRRFSDHRTGNWSLNVEDALPGDLDMQIRELLAKVSDDLEVWRGITARHQACVFTGLFMGSGNEMLDLTPETLGALASRRLTLRMDIYGPSDDDPSDPAQGLQ
jgi:hypothetical protein